MNFQGIGQRPKTLLQKNVPSKPLRNLKSETIQSPKLPHSINMPKFLHSNDIKTSKFNNASFLVKTHARRRVFTPTVMDSLSKAVELSKLTNVKFDKDGKLNLSIPLDFEDAPLMSPEKPKIPQRKIRKDQKQNKLKEFLNEFCPEQFMKGKPKENEDRLKARQESISNLIKERDDIVEFYNANRNEHSSTESLEKQKSNFLFKKPKKVEGK